MSHPATSQRSTKLAISAALTALALIFSYIELLIPFSVGIPGVKLGLANVVALVALYTVGHSYALSINILRVILAGLLFGNVFSIIYSLSGALLSFGVMVLLKKTNQFSIVGVSMAGGVFHNLGQIAVAAMVVENSKLFYYFPVLLFAGMATGIAIGIVAYMVCKRVK